MAFASSVSASDLVNKFAAEAVAEIFRATPKMGRAPVLHLTPQVPNGCNEAVSALAAEARKVTDVHFQNTSDILNERHAFDVFNVPPGPHSVAAKTPFEEYLDAKPYGGIAIFASFVGHENKVTAERVLNIIKAGKHVSQAGHFKTARQAIVLQSGDKITVTKRGLLRELLPPSLWSGTINQCRYDLVDGDAFAQRIAAADTPIETPVAEDESTLREFAEDIVTRIGQGSGPLLLPPLVVLTPVNGQSCGLLAATIHEVAQTIMPSYQVFAEDGQGFTHASFNDFVAKEKRGLLVVRASSVKMRTQAAVTQAGQFILTQWQDRPNGGLPMDRFGYVLEAAPDVELMPGFKLERVLDRAHAAKEARGCRFSLIPGLSILTLLKEHKKCQVPLVGPTNT